ncbi:MAG: methionyl-tRNA formyltransferase, partial [Spirochaetales bacterium]|nr:methionyl-tRNA formyltransferase [Spirochaetales bacterium]
MRIFFAGTPDMAVPSLEALNECFDVCGVLTNPDKAKGRGRKLQPSPVKAKALELGLTVFQPEKLDGDFREQVAALKPDVLVCIAFGKIFRQSFLDLFPRGGVNLHPSLLPKYRGPSPVSEAIKNGDRETAVTIQRLALKMDSGDILFQKPYTFEEGVTTGDFLDLVARDGALYMVEVLTKMSKGELTGIPQDEERATFCSLVNKEDGLIDWNSSAEEIERLIRAYSPLPGCFTFWDDQILFLRKASVDDQGWKGEEAAQAGQVLGVDKKRGILVKTGDGLICLKELQLQSRKSL